ncbi:MAG: hypothetical protein Q8P67_25030, partial [archaeon]|nr:hypothetical protein [archaeon]
MAEVGHRGFRHLKQSVLELVGEGLILAESDEALLTSERSSHPFSASNSLARILDPWKPSFLH